jgi:hypothetical protein
MHAVYVTVNIAAGQFEQARKALHERVIPGVKQAPGVVKGFWTVSADATKGASMVVFDSKDHAEDAAQMVRQQPPPPGVALNSVEVREVVADV